MVCGRWSSIWRKSARCGPTRSGGVTANHIRKKRVQLGPEKVRRRLMAVQSLHVSNVENGEQECRGKLPVELVEDLVEVEEELGVLEKRLDGTP